MVLRNAICTVVLPLLMACGGVAPSEHDRDTTVAVVQGREEGRPVLVPAGVEIVQVLRASGSPWDKEPIFDKTSYTGGSIDLSRRLVIFPEGSISVDRSDDGGIHSVTIRSGVGERCGNPAVLGRAYASLSGTLNVPLPNDQQFSTLKKGWAGDGWDEIAFSDVLVRAVGGCVKAVVFKAVI